MKVTLMMKKRAKISMMVITTHLMGGNACHVVALAKLDEPGTLIVIFQYLLKSAMLTKV